MSKGRLHPYFKSEEEELSEYEAYSLGFRKGVEAALAALPEKTVLMHGEFSGEPIKNMTYNQAIDEAHERISELLESKDE